MIVTVTAVVLLSTAAVLFAVGQYQARRDASRREELRQRLFAARHRAWTVRDTYSRK